MSLFPLGFRTTRMNPLGQWIQQLPLRPPLGWNDKPLGQSQLLQPLSPLSPFIQTALLENPILNTERRSSWLDFAELNDRPPFRKAEAEPSASTQSATHQTSTSPSSRQSLVRDEHSNSETTTTENDIQLKPLGQREPLASTSNSLNLQLLPNSPSPSIASIIQSQQADTGEGRAIDLHRAEPAMEPIQQRDVAPIADSKLSNAIQPATEPSPQRISASPGSDSKSPNVIQPALETQFTAVPLQIAQPSVEVTPSESDRPLLKTSAEDVLTARSTEENLSTNTSLPIDPTDSTPVSLKRKTQESDVLLEKVEALPSREDVNAEAASPTSNDVVIPSQTSSIKSVEETTTAADILQPRLKPISPTPAPIQLQPIAENKKAFEAKSVLEETSAAFPHPPIVQPSLEPVSAAICIEEIGRPRTGSTVSDETAPISSVQPARLNPSLERDIQEPTKAPPNAESQIKTLTPLLAESIQRQTDTQVHDRSTDILPDLTSQKSTLEVNKQTSSVQLDAESQAKSEAESQAATVTDRGLSSPEIESIPEIEVLPTPLQRSIISSPEEAAVQRSQIAESIPLLQPLGASKPIASSSNLLTSPSQSESSAYTNAPQTVLYSDNETVSSNSTEDVESVKISTAGFSKSLPSAQLRSANSSPPRSKDTPDSWSNLDELLGSDSEIQTKPLPPLSFSTPLGFSRSPNLSEEKAQPSSNLASEPIAPIRRRLSEPQGISNADKNQSASWSNLSELMGQPPPTSEQMLDDTSLEDEVSSPPLTSASPTPDSAILTPSTPSTQKQIQLQAVGQNSQTASIDQQQLEMLAQGVYQLIRQYLSTNQERYDNRPIGYPVWLNPVISVDKTSKGKSNESPSTSSEAASIDSKTQTLTREVYGQIQQRVTVDRERRGYSKIL